MIDSESDRLWHEDADLYGWRLTPTPWPLRLWGVRHIRHAWLSYKVWRRAEELTYFGIGLGRPNQRDLWVLYAIYRGWA